MTCTTGTRRRAAAGFLAAALAMVASPAWAVSPDIVISQVYGAGGNTGATWRNDYIELFNRGSSPVNVNGWSVQYAASAGTTWSTTPLTNVNIQPGQYYLVLQASGGGGGTIIPLAADATGTIAMSATDGKVALVNSTTALVGACFEVGASGIVDFIGYGAPTFGGNLCWEGIGRSGAPSTTLAVFRNLGGCQDTDNNKLDTATAAANPRNSTSPLNVCGAPIGACCVGGSCSQQTAANCAASMGTYFGDYVACSETNYYIQRATNALEDISTTGAVLMAVPSPAPASGTFDDGSTSIALPFAFSFYGQSKTSIRIGNNGYMTFSGTATDGNAFSRTHLPTAATPNDLICPLWDDLDMTGATGANIRTEMRGAAPNRRFIVQWTLIPIRSFIADTNTFEAILYETSNVIEYRYHTIRTANASLDAAAGDENTNGSIGSQRPDGLLLSGESMWLIPPRSCTTGVGACCTGSSCQITTAALCLLAGGVYQGDATTCMPNPCTPPGACCLTNGNCVVVTVANCNLQGGTFRGDNTNCMTINPPCPPGGACCATDGTCTIRTLASCNAVFGMYQGDGTLCTPNNPCVGRCCGTDGSCSITTPTQCATAGGQYGGGGTNCSTLVSGNTPLEDISGTGALLISTAMPPTSGTLDDGSSSVSLPFAFRFFGQPKTSLQVGTNGYATFSATPTDGNIFSNVAIPNAAVPNDMICPFWDDMNMSSSGTVVTQTLGSGNSRRFIVQWTAVPFFSGGGSNTFQIILYECTGNVELRYGAIGSAASATTGIENATGTAGTQVPSADVVTGRSFLLLPQPPCYQLGACCLGAMCSQLSEPDCCLGGGTFQGIGIPCTPNPCTPPGACCVGTSCSFTSEVVCFANSGIFQGSGTPCTPNPCAGACCVAVDGSCQVVTPTDCTTLGGVYQGPGTECAAVTYSISTNSTPFCDISDTGTLLIAAGTPPTTGTLDDGNSVVAFPGGFDFRFFGTAQTSVRIGTNGYLTFSADGSTFSNAAIPNGAIPNNIICPLWDDYNLSTGGNIRTQVFGNAPNRRFIAQWTAVPHFSFTSVLQTFQAILYEGADVIEYRYRTLAPTPSVRSATTGVENAAGTAGSSVADASLLAGVNQVFTPVYPCVQPLGACYACGGCTQATQADCALGGGQFGGNGSVCETTLCLSMADSCLAPGETVVVNLSMSNLSRDAAGFQAFLNFDSSRLAFMGGVYTPSPFGLPVIDPITATVGGDIDLASGIDRMNGQTTSGADALLASLSFVVLSGPDDCATIAPIGYRPHDPPTRITDDLGVELVPLVLVGLSGKVTYDGTPPQITAGTCPPDAMVDTDPGLCTATFSFVAPSATDNCDTTPAVTCSRSDSLPLTDPYSKGVTAVTCVATDDCGNVSAPCMFNVTVNDNQDPTLTPCPADIVTDTDPGVCTAVVNWTPPMASDNCPMYTLTSTHNPGDAFAKGVTQVTYTVTDMSGRTASCSFNVTVNDNQDPTLTPCPADIVTDTDPGLCTAVVNWTPPMASDNCPMYTLTSTHNPGDAFAKGVTQVTYTVTDMSGRMASCSFNVTVNDNQDPTLTPCPADIMQDTDPGVCSAVVTWTPPTGADNCPMYTVTSSHNPGDSFGLGTTVVTYAVTDMSGRTASCSFNVTIEDNEGPMFSGCPGDIHTNVNMAGCQAMVSWTPPTATDNCGGMPTVVSSHNPGDVFAAGTTTVTYTATDAYGNMSTCEFDVVVTPLPDMNNDGMVTAAGDLQIFINVLLGLDTDSLRVARADTNCDGKTNGGDIQGFVDLIAP